MITEEQIAYIGGFMDGEACIQMNKNGGISVSTGQVSKEPMDVLAELTGSALTQSRPNLATRQRGRWNHTVSGEKAAILLRRVLPYLCVKRPQAAVALQLMGLSVAERKVQGHRLNDLNRIGRDGPEFVTPVLRSTYFPPRWSTVERARHAGFFDAEGCVSASKTNKTAIMMRVSVTQVNPLALLDISDTFAFPIYRTKPPKERNARDLHTVILTGDRGYTYLSLMYDYLLVKDRQAFVYLENYDRSVDERRAAKDKLDRMNAIGLVKTRELEIEELLDEYDPPALDDVWSPRLITPFGELNPELLHFAAPAFLRCS